MEGLWWMVWKGVGSGGSCLGKGRWGTNYLSCEIRRHLSTNGLEERPLFQEAHTSVGREAALCTLRVVDVMNATTSRADLYAESWSRGVCCSGVSLSTGDSHISGVRQRLVSVTTEMYLGVHCENPSRI